jgi:heat shock protein HslJ
MVGLAVVSFSGIGCDKFGSSGGDYTVNNGGSTPATPTPNSLSKSGSVDWSVAVVSERSSFNETYVQNDNPIKTIKGTKWKVVGIKGLNKIARINGDERTFQVREFEEPKNCEKCYTLAFDADGSFEAFSAANEFFGRYTVDGNNTIKIIDFGGTKIGSPNEDNKLFESLFWDKTIESFSIEDDELILFSKKDNSIGLIFKLSK